MPIATLFTRFVSRTARLRLLAAALTASLLPSLAPAQAPVPAAQALAGPDAAQACRQAHLGQAQRTAQATLVSVRHRQKMDRYDVQWYKLDLALENTSQAVAGSALLRVRALQALDSVAFELYPAPTGTATVGLTIDSVVAGGRRSPGVLRRG